MLNADGDEDEDQQIRQQGGEHEGADGSSWRPVFSPETDGEVSDEHALSICPYSRNPGVKTWPGFGNLGPTNSLKVGPGDMG